MGSVGSFRIGTGCLSDLFLQFQVECVFSGLFFCCLEFCFLCEFSEGLGVLFLEGGSVAGLDGLLGF